MTAQTRRIARMYRVPYWLLPGEARPNWCVRTWHRLRGYR